MPDNRTATTTLPVPAATKHQLALMIWMAVLPTLIVLNLVLNSALADLPMVLRTFVLATVAVPIVIYCLMPLHGCGPGCSDGRDPGACSVAHCGARPGALLPARRAAAR